MTLEKTLNSEIKQVYHKLRSILVEKKCRIILETEPTRLCVVQGSLWGTSPETAQKKITYVLNQDREKTNVTSDSILTRGYVNLTLVGCALSIILLALCIWIAWDLQSVISAGNVGFWGWLVQTGGFVNVDKASFFIFLTGSLSAFLVITLIAEAFIVWRVLKKIEGFSREILDRVN